MKKTNQVIASSAMTCMLFISGLTFPPDSRAETFPPITGVLGTAGDDVITQVTPVDATANESVYEIGLFDVSAIGIDVLPGNDTVINLGDGSVTTYAGAEAITVIVGLGVGVNASGIGIDAGPDNDSVTVGAPLVVTSHAATNTGTASLFFEQVPSILGFNATARSTGAVGGTGTDSLLSDDLISVKATAVNNLLQLTLTPVELPADVFGLGLTPATADALAIGLSADGGASSCSPLFAGCVTDPSAGQQTLESGGALEVTAEATVMTDKISVELLGKERGDTSTGSTAAAAGIVGGSFGDDIKNSGTMDIDSVARSTSFSVDVKFGLLPVQVPTPPEILLESFGAAISESNTVADARAIGIDAGNGDDTVINSGTSGYIGEGPADNLPSPLPSLTGDFIENLSFTGPQLDYCEDDSTADVCAQAIASSTELRFEIPKPPTSFAITTSSAVAGADTVTSVAGEAGDGLYVSEMATRAHALATGIAGDDGKDAITNSSPFAVETYAYADSASISASLGLASGVFPVSVNVPVADGETGAEAETYGLTGGAGDDSIVNTDELGVLSTAKATSGSMALDIQAGEKAIAAGVGIADGSTVGAAFAAGIDGMGGADHIFNGSLTSSKAHSEIITNSTVVSISGVAEGFAGAASLTSAESAAHADSVGIDGGEHGPAQGVEGDTIDNEGVVETNAKSIAISKSMSLTAAFAGTGMAIGASLADANTTAHANATGIRTDAGEDTVTSRGDLDQVTASSQATSASDSVAVTLAGAYEGISVGVSAARARTNAVATAVGIDTGAGDDAIDSGAYLKSDAQADSKTNTRSVTISIAPVSFGAALADAGAVSEATSVGISSGTGEDDVSSHGVIDVDAKATTDVEGIAISASLFGIGSADLTATALTHAAGIDGGAGPDLVTNAGRIDVDATSVIDAFEVAATLILKARADLLVNAKASAFGIIAGDGSQGASVANSIVNAEGAWIDVTASARSNADSYAVIGGGSASAKAGSTTQVDGTGILGGLGVDTITNSGKLDVTATSVNSAISFGFTGAGFQTIDADISAKATATGVDASEGANVIVNNITTLEDGTIVKGIIDVHTQVENLAGSVGAGILDFNFTSADASAETVVSGIRSGAEVDNITNEGVIDVTTSIFNDAGAGALGLFSFSFVENLSTATLEGINSGGGDDSITNSGLLTVGKVVSSFDPDKCLDVSIACARAASYGIDMVSLRLADLGSSATLTGIAGGAGNDTIVNSKDARLAVGDADNWMVISETDSITDSIVAFLDIALAFGTADLKSTGINGGESNDSVANAGEITVHARSFADVYSEIEIDLVGLTTSQAFSDAHAVASARGIAGGGGDDDLENSGSLTVKSHAKSKPRAVMEVGIAGANATVESNTDATAIGMDAGSGSNMLTNSTDGVTDGVIVVESVGEADASTRTTTGDFVLAESSSNYVSINSAAWGMRAGVVDDKGPPWLLGDDVLKNMGDMTVTARAGKSEVLSIDAFAEDRVEVGPKLDDNASENPSVGNPGVKMYASATGMDSGAGRDEMHNAKAIEVNALSYAWGKAETYSFDESRDDDADMSIMSSATAVGLRGEGETTRFTNNKDTATLTVTAKATGYAEALTDGRQDARSDAWMKAEASATGVLAEGHVTIDNVGTVEVVAQAEPDSYAFANEGGGEYGESRASGIADARAAGFKVGDSGSSINNHGTMNVTATAGGLEIWVSSAADEKAKSNGEADATATGILTGGGFSNIVNRRALVVDATAQARVFATDVPNSLDDPDVLLVKASATASATGISAGAVDGNDVGNLIWNLGDIEVSATAEASYSLGSDADDKDVNAVAQSSGIGIETGGGDDILYNAGSITTLEKVEEQGVVKKESAGTAISSGDGKDEVYLVGDSLAYGRILLGAGDDLITFRDFAQVLWTENGLSTPGVIVGGDGIDTLRIEDRNSFTIAPPAAMEILQVDEGQLVIAGDYAPAENHLLQVAIYNPTEGELGHGQLIVDGNATLDGTLSVVALPRLYQDGETFDVVAADWIDPANDFSVVDLPAPTPLLSLSVVDPRPLDQIVRIETSVNPFGTAAKYPLQATIADYLDQLAPTATGDLASLLGAFQLTPASGIDAAFASLSPDSYQALTSLAIINGLDHMRSLQRRMLTVRAPMMSAGFAGLGNDLYLLAYNGDDPGAVGVPHAAVTSGQGRPLTAGGFLVSGDRSASRGYTGFDYSSWGFSLSPQLVRENFLAGVSLGYSRSDVDFSNGRGDGEIRAWYAGTFGSVYSDDAYVEAGLAFSAQEYENQRNIRIDGFRATAKSEHDGDVVQAFLGAGYTFDTHAWALQPFASLYYTWIDEDGFTETGADVANLAVDGENTESLIGEAGVRMSRRLDAAGGDLDLDLSIGLNHDFDIDDRKVTAGLLSAPGTSFTIDDRDVKQTSAVFGAGVTFKRRDTTFSFQYRGQFNGDDDSHAVIATVGIEF